MKLFLPVLLGLLLLAVPPVPTQAENGVERTGHGRMQRGKMDCDTAPLWCKSEDGTCRPEMRGRCGKRRGDWYGASQPVPTAAEARRLLQNYFTGQEYTVSELIEKKWGFKAEIVDKSGKIIDRVMIDKRTGRIRSLN